MKSQASKKSPKTSPKSSLKASPKTSPTKSKQESPEKPKSIERSSIASPEPSPVLSYEMSPMSPISEIKGASSSNLSDQETNRPDPEPMLGVENQKTTERQNETNKQEVQVNIVMEPKVEQLEEIPQLDVSIHE